MCPIDLHSLTFSRMQPSWMDTSAACFKPYDMKRAYSKMLNPSENSGNKAIDGNGIQRINAFNKVSIAPSCLLKLSCLFVRAYMPIETHPALTAFSSGCSLERSPKTPSWHAATPSGLCRTFQSFCLATSR